MQDSIEYIVKKEKGKEKYHSTFYLKTKNHKLKT